MKKLAYILILIAVVLTSCNDYETYGDKKEKERNAISKFIADSSFTVISEEDCRYTEYDILNDSTMTFNNTVGYASVPDRMTVTCTSGTFTASFLSGRMASAYSSSVPAGWLVPLTYIKVGRPQSMDDECAKVRLIVPHTQGHVYASSNVTPFFYTITFQREIQISNQ